jgi:capsular exopolysaccharide synthesis family protein
VGSVREAAIGGITLANRGDGDCCNNLCPAVTQLRPSGRRTSSSPVEKTHVIEVSDRIATDWRQPPEEQEGLQRYVETVRERIWLILVTVAVTTGIAILYVATATKTYEAEADLLITPVTGDDPVLTSLGLIRQSADPTRDVETASRLVTNINVAERVKKATNSPRTPSALLSSVRAEPVAQSNVVAVTGRSTTPEGAQRLANSFARQAVGERTAELHQRIDDLIPQLEQQQAQGDAGPLATQIAQLEILRASPDPTMRVQTTALTPSAPVSPRPMLSLAGGIIAGLILGVVAAFGAQVLDPRLRREAQLRRSYRLPILGRIPKEAKSQQVALAPRAVSPVTGEAYRALRASLVSSKRGNPDDGKVILVTGSSPSEGKTTTAVNLATSLALSGKRVILIESDLRRPVLAQVMGARPEHGGVVSVLIENTTLVESLIPSSTYGPNLRMLLSDYEGGWIAELFSIPTAARMIQDARRMADYVIVDSAPLNEVVDALPLAQEADEVLIVVRLGVTRLDKLAQLTEMLAENGVKPVGFAVIGVPRPKRNEYHYFAEPDADGRGGRQPQLLAEARRTLRS